MLKKLLCLLLVMLLIPAASLAEVVVTSYGDSAVAYSVRFWTKTEHYWEAHNFSLEEIRRCFARKGVTMTYNHLNVHILDNTKEK